MDVEYSTLFKLYLTFLKAVFENFPCFFTVCFACINTAQLSYNCNDCHNSSHLHLAKLCKTAGIKLNISIYSRKCWHFTLCIIYWVIQKKVCNVSRPIVLTLLFLKLLNLVVFKISSKKLEKCTTWCIFSDRDWTKSTNGDTADFVKFFMGLYWIYNPHFWDI